MKRLSHNTLISLILFLILTNVLLGILYFKSLDNEFIIGGREYDRESIEADLSYVLRM